MNPKVVLLFGCGMVVTLSACGTPAHVAALHSPAARPASSPSASSQPSPSDSPPPSAQPSPSASQEPKPAVPPGPVVVVKYPNGMVAATTAEGMPLWAFDPVTLGIPDPNLVAAGPNLLTYRDGRVAIIDRTGVIIGRAAYGTLPGNLDPEIFPSPAGTRWAWTAPDSTEAAGAQGQAENITSLWIAGIGEGSHRVTTWTGAYVVSGVQWSDAGIVVVKLGPTCGERPLSSTLVDPTTGAEQALFGADLWPLDVHAGLRVAASTDRHTLEVAGAIQMTRTYPLSIGAARISPAGDRIFVSTTGEANCGGRRMVATSVIDVRSSSQTTMDGFFGEAWLGETRLLGRSLEGGPGGDHVQLSDLAGHRSNLVLGTLVGVLRP